MKYACRQRYFCNGLSISASCSIAFDLHIEVPAVEYRDILRARNWKKALRRLVSGWNLREQKRARFCSDKKVSCNARMGPRQIRQHCQLSDRRHCSPTGKLPIAGQFGHVRVI